MVILLHFAFDLIWKLAPPTAHQVVALQIMRANYQQLVKAHQQVPREIDDI